MIDLLARRREMMGASGSDPYANIEWDVAWTRNGTGPIYKRAASGYCVLPLEIETKHRYKFYFGFTNPITADDEVTYDSGVVDRVFADGTRGTAMVKASNIVVTAVCNYTPIEITFNSANINDCYVYDETINEYIWKGQNVT